MVPPHPNLLFAPLAARLPPLAPRSLALGAAAAVAGAAGAIAFRHPWVGGTLLLAGFAADGLGQAMARRTGTAALAAVPLALLLVPFGFALADPGRALAAMFLILSLSLFTTQGALAGRSEMRWLHGLAGLALLLACLFPDRFSLSAYLVGIICFASVGRSLVQT